MRWERNGVGYVWTWGERQTGQNRDFLSTKKAQEFRFGVCSQIVTYRAGAATQYFKPKSKDFSVLCGAVEARNGNAGLERKRVPQNSVTSSRDSLGLRKSTFSLAASKKSAI